MRAFHPSVGVLHSHDAEPLTCESADTGLDSIQGRDVKVVDPIAVEPNDRVEIQGEPPSGTRPKPKPRIKWARWAWLAVVLLVVGSIIGMQMMPRTVVLSRPETRLLAETIASSGVAQGHTEVSVGAQSQGIITKLYVEEGAQVKKGQVLAEVQNDVALQQVEQARQSLETARRVLAQSAEGPLSSEIRSAQSRVSQAQAAIRQQSALIEKAKLGQSLANTNVRQARVQVSRAETTLRQSQARLDLAQKTLDRKSMLAKAGAIPQSDFDAAQSAYDVAAQDLASSEDSLSSAHLSVDAAVESVDSTRKDLEAAVGQLSSVKAQLSGAQSDLATLRSHPRQVDVAVAAQRVHEAQAAFQTAQALARNTGVVAPFAGTVTDIVAQTGSSPGISGILRLVQTGRLEIKLDLDEANLRDVRVGQRAVISVPSATAEVQGHVVRIGSQIDSLRGTLEVYVTTDEPVTWIHPGQTLNVNVVTIEKVQRLLVPSTAVQREGDQTLVYVDKDGKATPQPVRLGLVLGDKVAVLDGLAPNDLVIQNSYQILPGTRVRSQK